MWLPPPSHLKLAELAAEFGEHHTPFFLFLQLFIPSLAPLLNTSLYPRYWLHCKRTLVPIPSRVELRTIVTAAAAESSALNETRVPTLSLRPPARSLPLNFAATSVEQLGPCSAFAPPPPSSVAQPLPRPHPASVPHRLPPRKGWARWAFISSFHSHSEELTPLLLYLCLCEE